MREKIFGITGCFELVKQGGGSEGRHAHIAHIMASCPQCGIESRGTSSYRGGMIRGIVSPLPYRGALDLKCEGCGLSLRVYVNTDTGEVALLGPRVCCIVRGGS